MPRIECTCALYCSSTHWENWRLSASTGSNTCSSSIPATTSLRACFELRVEQASRLFALRNAAEKQARRLFNCAVSPILN
jgi:hypothetical protein